VQRSVQCSCPDREGVIRCTVVVPQQRGGIGNPIGSGVVRGLFERTFLIFHEIAKI
jgi:hypothetical protein